MITEDECQTIIMNVMAAHHPEPVPEVEIKLIVEWANKVAVDYAMLESIMKGNVLVKWGEDEPTFSLSPKGRKIAENLDRNE